MKDQVEKVIDKIRPQLQMDGGDIELVDVVDGVVKVRLKGACGTCPMSAMTLKSVRQSIRESSAPTPAEGRVERIVMGWM